MIELKGMLIKVVAHCCDVKTFRFKLERDVVYEPGQYLVLTLTTGGKKISKALSISSSPTEIGYIEVTKKISSSDFSKILDHMVPGDEVFLRLPMGKFTLPFPPPELDALGENKVPKVAFLSGGIGITPIRSILKFLADKNLNVDVVLLYSSRSPEYLIFQKDLVEIQEVNKNIKIIFTLSDCKVSVPGCRHGHIDDQMVREVIPDYPERTFYICGPPGMVEAMRSMLKDKLALSVEKIVTEDFVGY
jgi:ferredoxin-NADP reductase